MSTLAELNSCRLSPQKCRVVADQIRGINVGKALRLLEFSNRKAANAIKKLLESAISNAEHNDGADIDNLRVAKIEVNEGKKLKRMLVRAKGRANRIEKPICNIVVRVSE